MLKILGSTLILVASSALGIVSGREIHSRCKELEELYKVFTLFQLELKFYQIPIKEVFLKLCNKVDWRYQEWMRDISDTDDFMKTWENTIDKYFKESHLTKEEKNELKELGKNLGCSEAISLYLSNLERSIHNTREEEKEKKKLYQSMGVMGGIFLVILLL